MWDNKTIEWLDIELTSFCNIDCPGCFRQIKRKTVDHILNKEMLTFEALRKWITPKEFPKLKLVNFCGSIDEPTLHPEILDIVKYFNKHSVDINISTNGSTKTRKFWTELGYEKVSAFFGIDGIDQKSLEKYRIGSNFKKLQENWKAFIKAGGKATWQFIVFEHNEHLLDDAKQMADKEGFDNFRVIYSHRSDNKESKTKIRNEEQEIVCKYGVQKRLFLSHTGTLLPCCFFNSEFLQVHSGGGNETRYTEKYLELDGPLESNLKYNTPTEVIEGDMFKFIVNSWNTNPLERCWQTCKKAKQDIFVDEELK
tara:strand:+ start:2646 stop:3578 length:933 start_codon:yes stop_codon:yes gene_type:complete